MKIGSGKPVVGATLVVARSRQQPIFIPLCCLSQGHGDSRKRPVPYPRYGGDPCLTPPPFKEEGWGEGNIPPLPFAGEGWGEGESPCSARCLASGFRPNYRLRKYHRERESTKIPAPSAPSAVNLQALRNTLYFLLSSSPPFTPTCIATVPSARRWYVTFTKAAPSISSASSSALRNPCTDSGR